MAYVSVGIEDISENMALRYGRAASNVINAVLGRISLRAQESFWGVWSATERNAVFTLALTNVAKGGDRAFFDKVVMAVSAYFSPQMAEAIWQRYRPAPVVAAPAPVVAAAPAPAPVQQSTRVSAPIPTNVIMTTSTESVMGPAPSISPSPAGPVITPAIGAPRIVISTGAPPRTSGGTTKSDDSWLPDFSSFHASSEILTYITPQNMLIAAAVGLGVYALLRKKR